jgi:MFS family permease
LPSTSATAETIDLRLIVALGTTQIISWGTLYYTFALLVEPLQRDLGAARGAVVGAFSLALLSGGAAATWVGRRIDRAGGRGVMTAGSIAGGVLLAALARVDSLAGLYGVWFGLGLAMAATLYEPAFAVVTRAYPIGYRRAITLLTLFGGFASTAFWPLTTLLMERLGWRDAMLALAGLNLLVCAPLHAWLLDLPRGRAASGVPAGKRLSEALATPTFYALAVSFLCHLLVISAVGVLLIALLLEQGLAPATAAAIGAVIGPMQVAGRLIEFLIAHRWRATRLGLVAVGLMPVALLVFVVAGGSMPLLVLFVSLYGISNGTMTIVRGTAPVELFGRAHYGAIAALLSTPGLLARAAGPFVAALLWSIGGGAHAVAIGLAALAGIGAMAYLVALRSHART